MIGLVIVLGPLAVDHDVAAIELLVVALVRQRRVALSPDVSILTLTSVPVFKPSPLPVPQVTSSSSNIVPSEPLANCSSEIVPVKPGATAA